MEKVDITQNKVIVTSGKKYIDIDAYAACISYAKLLKQKGINAIAVTKAELNESIPQSIFGNINYLNIPYQPEKEDKFIVLDVSNEEFFDVFVNPENIIEIIDHHPGFEEYWKSKLGDRAIIQEIGSVATIIVEKYDEEGCIDKISKEEAYLLMAAILDNTLNFGAQITSIRDRKAYKKLLDIVNNDINFEKKYFLECQKYIEENLEKIIINATKNEKICNNLPTIFSQLVVWDKISLINRKNEIYQQLEEMGTDWILNIICLNEEKSYIMCKNNLPQKKMENLFKRKFNEDILELDKVWLRKEIIKKARSCTN